jgi:hypothetical protein
MNTCRYYDMMTSKMPSLKGYKETLLIVPSDAPPNDPRAKQPKQEKKKPK